MFSDLVKDEEAYEKIMKIGKWFGGSKADRERGFAKNKGTIGNIFFCLLWSWDDVCSWSWLCKK